MLKDIKEIIGAIEVTLCYRHKNENWTTKGIQKAYFYKVPSNSSYCKHGICRFSPSIVSIFYKNTHKKNRGPQNKNWNTKSKNSTLPWKEFKHKKWKIHFILIGLNKNLTFFLFFGRKQLQFCDRKKWIDILFLLSCIVVFLL